MHTKQDFTNLAADFRQCRPVLAALGEETRLHILYQMMVSQEPRGLRVGEIGNLTSLSRPAVSHHLKILREAGIVRVRREGTMSFYYLEPDMASFKALISVLQRSVDFAAELPYRGEE